MKKLIRSQASLVEKVENVRLRLSRLRLVPITIVDSDFGLRASQVEMIWVFLGFLLHYSVFGILHSIFCLLRKLKKLIRSQASLVEEVETFAFGSLV